MTFLIWWVSITIIAVLFNYQLMQFTDDDDDVPNNDTF